MFDLLLFVICLTAILGVFYDMVRRYSKLGRIDWHDWELIEQDKLLTGLGEQGAPAYLSSYPPYSKDINDTFGYNGYLSDRISLTRSLKDVRPHE